jgi:hypothetical protein
MDGSDLNNTDWFGSDRSRSNALDSPNRIAIPTFNFERPISDRRYWTRFFPSWAKYGSAAFSHGAGTAGESPLGAQEPQITAGYSLCEVEVIAKLGNVFLPMIMSTTMPAMAHSGSEAICTHRWAIQGTPWSLPHSWCHSKPSYGSGEAPRHYINTSTRVNVCITNDSDFFSRCLLGPGLMVARLDL